MALPEGVRLPVVAPAERSCMDFGPGRGWCSGRLGVGVSASGFQCGRSSRWMRFPGSSRRSRRHWGGYM